MKRLLRTPQSIEAQMLIDLLEQDGIPAELVTPRGSMVAEGVMSFEASPEVWVNDEDLNRALEVKKDWVLQRSLHESNP